MEGYLFCGLSEQLETMEVRRSNLSRWWVRDNTNWPEKSPRDIVRRCVSSAMEMWCGVANVKAIEAPSEQEADLVIHPASIDGRQGVLADCMLPGPRVQICRLDSAELWTVQLGPAVDQNFIDLDRVLRHELGHYWGIGHDRKGAKSLMAPTYSRSIWDAREWDREQLIALYGPPSNPSVPGEEIFYGAFYNQNGREMKRFKMVEIPPS